MPPILKVIFSRRMLVSALMGFSCGLPLLLTLSVLQAWMKQEGVDLGTIGLMSLVGLPYTLKFLWSPFLDYFTLPFLGRRRGWLLIAQLCLTGAIAGLGLSNPAANPWMVAFIALLVTFFSASQDIVVDAYRREDLADDELGLGSSLYVNGYRVGMLLASGGGLIMADHMSFGSVYLIMAGCMSVGLITTLVTPEPEATQWIPRHQTETLLEPAEIPLTIREMLREALKYRSAWEFLKYIYRSKAMAVMREPLEEYFSRSGALWMLAFILMYKIGDQMASTMTTPFYLDIGFTKTQIGAVVKLFGFWATIAGAFLGGVLILRLKIYRSLWFFGILQMVSTAGFALLAQVGASTWLLAGVVAFENLTAGMGTSAYVAFMAALTNKKFTATQYALLSSLMGVPRVFLSAPTGFMAEGLGWTGFFIFCTLIAVPGLLLLLKTGSMGAQDQPETQPGG